MLRFVDSRFTESGADAIQVGVQRTNFRSNWWSLHTALDNYFWYRSRLPVLAEARALLLGDNAVFVRREWLAFTQGWDTETPDGGLGAALSAAGARVDVVCSPEVVAREEAPVTLVGCVRERIRFNRGLARTLVTGGWWRLPRARHWAAAPRLLVLPLIEPVVGVLIPMISLGAIALNLSTAVQLVALVPLTPLLVLGAVRMTGLSEFGMLFGQRVRIRDYARLAVGAFPYQCLLLLALLLSPLRSAAPQVQMGIRAEAVRGVPFSRSARMAQPQITVPAPRPAADEASVPSIGGKK